MHVIVLLAKGDVPVHLIGQRIPSETNDWDSLVSDSKDIGPLFPQPIDALLTSGTLHQIGFGVHHRQQIAIVILDRDFVIAKDFA